LEDELKGLKAKGNQQADRPRINQIEQQLKRDEKAQKERRSRHSRCEQLNPLPALEQFWADFKRGAENLWVKTQDTLQDLFNRPPSNPFRPVPGPVLPPFRPILR
jgi:hypothetical protein